MVCIVSIYLYFEDFKGNNFYINDQDVEVEALPKRAETNTINRDATLLLRCDPQKKIVKHYNTNINAKAFNTCELYTKLKESSG